MPETSRLAANIDDGTLAIDLPEAVNRSTYAAAFRDGLADPRFETIARRPSFLNKRHGARRGGIPASRYARASASDPTPTEVRDLVRLPPRDLPAIAAIAVATLERLNGDARASSPGVRGR